MQAGEALAIPPWGAQIGSAVTHRRLSVGRPGATGGGGPSLPTSASVRVRRSRFGSVIDSSFFQRKHLPKESLKRGGHGHGIGTNECC